MQRTLQPANRWLRITQPSPQATMRLFCLPYAGGAASIYRTWAQHLPADIEICAVQLPGREERIHDRPFADLVSAVQAIIPHLLSVLDKPFALFGHSMGALIAYELARQLQEHDHRPTHLLVSGRRAPILPAVESPLHMVPGNVAFLNELQRRYNNIPAVMFKERELQELFVPMLRADLTLVETYQPGAPTPLPCPLIAFGGEDDPRATLAELQAWRALTQADFAMHRFPGGHFYLNEQVQSLLAVIAGYLG